MLSKDIGRELATNQTQLSSNGGALLTNHNNWRRDMLIMLQRNLAHYPDLSSYFSVMMVCLVVG
jgi:hypothetical protein